MVAAAPFTWVPEQAKWNKSALNHCLDPSLINMQSGAELPSQVRSRSAEPLSTKRLVPMGTYSCCKN